jgi:hypothetical protein
VRNDVQVKHKDNYQRFYTNCQKYVPIDLTNPSKVLASKSNQHVIASRAKQHVIASKAKQSNAKHHDPLRRIRLLRRKAPRNDRLSEYISDNRYIS